MPSCGQGGYEDARHGRVVSPDFVGYVLFGGDDALRQGLLLAAPARRFLVDFYRESGVRQEAAVVDVGGLDQGVGLEGAS